MAGEVKFIRKNGKVIPIKAGAGGQKLRKDKGVDLRVKGQNKYDRKLVSQTYEKYGKKATTGQKFKDAVGLGLIGGWLGGMAGGAAGVLTHVATKGKVNVVGKAAAAGAAALGGTLVYGSATQKAKRLSNRQFNKKYGQALAKKGSTGF